MKKDDYVKIVAVTGDFRYGYITDILDKGFTLDICLFDEGESKIAYDAAYNALRGEETIDYLSTLTDIERQIIPLLAAGFNTNKIAGELSTSPITVRAQLRTLRIKLRLDNRAQLNALSPALDSMIKKQAKVGEEVKNWSNQQITYSESN